jgi:hypothetical protein
LDVVDNAAVVGVTPTTDGCGANAGEGQLRSAITREGDVRRMPLVGSGEGGFRLPRSVLRRAQRFSVTDLFLPAAQCL